MNLQVYATIRQVYATTLQNMLKQKKIDIVYTYK